MRLGKTLHVTGRGAWRSWLARNHDAEKEVWLVYYRKSSGKPRIPYNDAVEEALCYGWIDGTLKRIDGERFAQRFTPRRASSSVSQMNRERIRKLVAQKKMTPAGLKAIEKIFDVKRNGRLVIPADIAEPLKRNGATWKNFQKFPSSYKRIRIAYLEGRRRHGEEAFRRSLRHLVEMTARNKRFGLVRD